jgi:hypothetical protein
VRFTSSSIIQFSDYNCTSCGKSVFTLTLQNTTDFRQAVQFPSTYKYWINSPLRPKENSLINVFVFLI